MPRDYEGLTKGGQREARVNGCRQWMVPGLGVEERARRYADCVMWFDRNYLWPQPLAGWDPMFYDQVCEPSDMHWNMHYWGALHKLCLQVLPRGSAKSTRTRVELLFDSVCVPGMSTWYVTSTQKNYARQAEMVRRQLAGNDYLIDDWGRMIPGKNEGTFNRDYQGLRNGAVIEYTSVGSRNRGGRPRKIVLDDPEYDSSGEKDSGELIEAMGTTIRKILLPMVMRAGTGLVWRGTFVSRKHYAYRVMFSGEGGEEDTYKRWAKVMVKHSEVTGEGKRVSCWPHMWPADEEEKKRLGLHRDAPTVEDVIEEVGEDMYEGEYQGSPGGSGVRYIQVEENSWATLEGWDGGVLKESKAKLCWEGPKGKQSVEVGELLRDGTVFCCIDTAYTNTQESDWKVCTWFVRSPQDGCLLVLGCIDGKLENEDQFVERCLREGDKYGTKMVCPEMTAQQTGLTAKLEALTRSGWCGMVGVERTPYVNPIKLPKMKKSAKLGVLERWFRLGVIKLPRWAAGEASMLRMVEQLEGFNPGAEDGIGLARDDHIDTLQMPQFVVRGGVGVMGEDAVEEMSPIERFRSGEVWDNKRGMPMLAGVPFRELDMFTVLEGAHARKRRVAGGTDA